MASSDDNINSKELKSLEDFIRKPILHKIPSKKREQK